MFFNKHKDWYENDDSPSVLQTKKKPRCTKKIRLSSKRIFFGTFIIALISVIADTSGVLNFLTGENLPGIIAAIHQKFNGWEGKSNSIAVETFEYSCLDILKHRIGKDKKIESYYVDDFNGDGNYEMFALITARGKWDAVVNYDNGFRPIKDPTTLITGEIWFVNSSGTQKIQEIVDYKSISPPFEIDNKMFLLCERSINEDDKISVLWGVNEEGKPYQPAISGLGTNFMINKYHDIEIICYDQDFFSPLGYRTIGVSRKPYYFYWDGKKFKEYAGKKISEDNLYLADGVETLLDKIYSELKGNGTFMDIQIKEIYYRENGVININFQCRENSLSLDNYNYNATLRFINNKLEIAPKSDEKICRKGSYYAFVKPSIAVSPIHSFESFFDKAK